MLRISPALICVLLLAGCSLHQPRNVGLPAELPEQYLEQTTPAETAVTPERWWLTLNDPQLDQLMSELFAENLQLAQAFARLEQSRAVLGSVSSTRYPSLSLEGQAGRSRQPQLSGDFTGDSWQLAATATFEIDLWNRLKSQIAAAEKDFSASLEDLSTLYLGLSAQLADLYYQAVALRAQLELSDRTITSSEETLALVERRYQKGLVQSIDVYQSRQILTGARANRHLNEANLAVVEHAIAVLLGRYPDRESSGELSLIPPTPEAFPAGLPAELIAKRPDLQAALRRVEAADARIATAIAERFPRVNLLGSYGRSSQDVAAGLIEGNFWNFLGQLAMPVVDAGRRKAEVERSRAVLEQAVAAYQQQVLIAFREVEDALARNRTTELRIEQLSATELSTAATLRLATNRYRSGLSDYLPVLTAQRFHFEAQSRLLSARQQLLTERISLARALGGSWMSAEIANRLNSEKAENHE
ncbi:MAG: efflux transporter outer membrane subunit [Desulfuromonadales bacterium]|nr:efflux transporter outer membrane subunit [Desulfuromonadales bacterium]